MTSEVMEILPNPCFSPSPTSRMSFLQLSACVEELLPTPKIIKSLSKLKFWIKKVKVDQIQYHYIQNNDIYQD